MARKKQALAATFDFAGTNVGKLTPEKVSEMAEKWVALIDADGNGTIDFDEFYEFFSNVDGIFLSMNEIKSLFTDFDKSGDGHLTVNEFAQALYLMLIPEGFEDEDGK